MPVKCGCGEEFDGDVCMACGSERAEQAEPTESEPTFSTEPTFNTPAAEPEGQNPLADDVPRGGLGEYRLDIGQSIAILDGGGNTIYDIPYGDAKCAMRLGALRISRTGSKSISMRGQGAKSWGRAIAYQQSPPVWFLHGAEDCEVMYGSKLLGVTPCVVVPPFSWAAFKSGHYELTIRRPGATPQQKVIRAASGTHAIKFPDGRPAERSGGKPEGDLLVLNGRRSLVLAEQPYLVDARGAVVLGMPGAVAKVSFMKRGATVSWNEPGLGKLSVAVKCDSKLKYDRLAEMLPPQKPQTPGPTAQPTDKPDQTDHPDMPDQPQYQNKPQPEPAKKESWWSRRRKPKGSKWNRGNFEGTDLRVTQNDLDTKMGRFDGYAFEGVCANLLASMGYKIEKGFDAKSGRILGPTKSDMGVDVLAVKGNDRVIGQCKHWKEQCGGPDVSKTIGAASVHNGTSVLMICTGGFSDQAVQIAKQSTMPVELWDWETLRKNLRRHLLK